MSYCRIHGSYSDSWDGCPDCQSAERETLATLDDLASRSRDFGDYQCPHCRYTTLRRNGTRCPLCHGSIPSTFWQELAAQERARERALKQATEQRQHEEQQRQQAVREELERTRPAREQAARSQWIRSKTRLAYGMFYAWLLPAFWLVTIVPFLMPWSSINIGQFVSFLYGAFIPLLNWYMCYLTVKMNYQQAALRPLLAGWAISGIFLVPLVVRWGARRRVGVP